MQIYNNNRMMPDMCDGLAMAFVKMQPTSCQTYDLKTALIKGTIYPMLDKPFVGKGVCCK